MSVPLNNNLSASYVRPTIAVAIDTNAAAGGDVNVASSVLLFTEQLAAGTATLNTVSPLTSVTDAINFYGTKSSAVRQLRNAIAQTNVPGAVTFNAVGVSEPSAGTAGIGQVCCFVPGTNPSGAGGETFTMGGSETFSISWTTADTATTIAASFVTAANLMLYEPWGTWTNSTFKATATANAKGAFVEDHSVRIAGSGKATGVYFGPGSLTLATNATGAGSIVLNVGAVAMSVAIADSDTPTLAGDKVVTFLGGTDHSAAVHLAANDYPITCGTNSAGVVPLYFVSNHDYRRLNVNVGTSTGMTAILTNGTITDGSGNLSNAPTYANTPGAGYPTLATAIANVHASGSYGKWVGPWFDATTVGVQFTSISTDGNGAPNQNRGQTITLCSTGTEAAAKTLIGATSPAMNANAANNNNGMRGAVCVFPDLPMPGYVYAAKIAAFRASSDPFTNYDFLPITGISTAPVILPSPMAIANFSDATQNTAIKDGITPLAIKDGSLVIVFGRTTLATSDMDLWDWCWIDQADDHRADFRAQAAPTFAGCSLIPDGTLPASRKDVSPQSMRGFLKAMLRRWEAQGTYVGASALAVQCDAAINAGNKSRIDAVYPESPKIPLHQIGVVAVRTAIPTT